MKTITDLITDVEGTEWKYNDSGVTEIDGLYYPVDSDLVIQSKGVYYLADTMEIYELHLK